MILIQDVPGAVERAPVLTGAQAQVVDRIEETWGGMCRLFSEAYGLPDGWLQAMIFGESEGNPNAFRREPNGWTGVGLLQITYPGLKGARKVTIDGKSKWVGGKSDEELFRPAVNLDVGAKYIASHYKLYGNDFPKVAAAFNAGSVRPPQDKDHENPWWLHSTGNHITREVSALNYWISKHKKLGHSNPELIDLLALAREADDAARRDTEPPPKESA